jgi:hypothetical protein
VEYKELKLSDRNLFKQFFSFEEYQLSTYSFGNTFIWKDHFRIFYIILDEHLCLFFKDKNSCFMYFPPLLRKINKTAGLANSDGKISSSLLNNCFEIMDRFNVNKDMSRIENVEQKNLALYQIYGYIYSVKPGDYLYKRQDIVSLSGNKFKSKRTCYNYFIKHYDFQFRPFLKQDIDDCLTLYQYWVKQRRDKFANAIYQAMLDESFRYQKVAMENSFELGLIGYVISINNRIVGYTFGTPLNPKTFCILFEVCDLTYKGVSQFIFSQFCRQLPDYQYINVMDDSGLENLRKVKLSYHPSRVIPNYIIRRNYA